MQIEEERLLNLAEERAGFGDFGDGGFRKPLRTLLEFLNGDEELALATRKAAAALAGSLSSSKITVHFLLGVTLRKFLRLFAVA